MSDERRTLVLLRHAKSDYPDGVADHDRPLAPRGEREAGLAGDWLRSDVIDPAVQAVLCSTATRTRQTLARTGVDAPVQLPRPALRRHPGRVIDEINGVDDGSLTLLVVGHEPAMSQLALGLAGAGRHQCRRRRTHLDRSTRRRRWRCCGSADRGARWNSAAPRW